MLTRNKILWALSLTAIITTAAAFEPPYGYGKRFENRDGSRIATILNLDENQQEEVQSIIQQHREEGKNWRSNHQKALDDKLSAVLTAEQLDQFKQHRAWKQQRREKRRGIRNNQHRMGPYMGMQGRRGNCNPPPRF